MGGIKQRIGLFIGYLKFAETLTVLLTFLFSIGQFEHSFIELIGRKYNKEYTKNE